MNVLRSEIIKTFSVRSTWVYLALIVFGMAAFSVLISRFTDGTTFTLDQISGGADLVLLILIFAVASIIGADKSRKTLAWTYLSTNRRGMHLAVQTLLVVGACVLAGLLGLALGVLGVFAFGGTIDWAASSEFAGYGFTLSSVVRWVFYGILAALLTRVLGSGVFAAMILVAEIFVLGALVGPGEGFLATLASLMPLPNTQTLVHGSNVILGIDHGRGFAAVVLGVLLAVAAAGAVWVAKRRAL